MSIDHHLDDESQTIIWLEHNARTITTDIIDDNWITEWATLTQKYFKNEKRNPIRLKLIALLSQIFSKFHVIFENELMERIIIPNFNDVHNETDSVVRKPIVHLLFDIATACLSPKHCISVMTIIKQILFKPFKPQLIETGANGVVGGNVSGAGGLRKPLAQSSFIYMIGNADIIDSRLIITKLNKLFTDKLHCLPIEPAVYMLDIAVDYLQLIFKHTIHDPIPAEIPMIRKELFSFFLNLRCNKHGHLGIQQPHQTLTQINYSPFIICVKKPRLDNTLTATSTTNSTTTNTPDNMSVSEDDDIYDEEHGQFQPNHDDQKLNPCQEVKADTPMLDKTEQIRGWGENFSISIPASYYYTDCPAVSKCITLDNMFGGIIDCISHETDTDVLKSVLMNLPSLLANKPFILTASNERINQLCLALSDLTRSSKSSSSSISSMTTSTTINSLSSSTISSANLRASNQQQHSSLFNSASSLAAAATAAATTTTTSSSTTTTTTNIDIVRCSINCLTSLPIYKSCLEHRTIKNMLAAFEESLKISRNQIVPSLTNCLIELQDSPEMTKFLPVVLNRLSKFSPTLNLGISILEFLSYLILFPKLYENFSGDEYKYIFAIALPYTNPFRFTDYITCLAFRTIAMWYLNCRPSLRCAFVEFVKKSLQSNVIQPFKENSTPTSSIIYHNNQQQQQQHQHYHHNHSTNHHLHHNHSHYNHNHNHHNHNYHQHHHNHHHQHSSLTSSPITTSHTPIIMHSNLTPTMSPADQRRRSASFNTENSFKSSSSLSSHLNHNHHNNLTTSNTPTSQLYHQQQQHVYHHQSSQSSLQLNEELIETFADLLSRYMHGQCLANAPKNKHIDSLIDRATSQTWLHGNSLITVTSDSTQQGWAEIFIRRPTGNTCWVGRLQNTQATTMPLHQHQQQANQQQVYLDSLNFSNDVISLFKTMSLTQSEEQQLQDSNSNSNNNNNNNNIGIDSISNNNANSNTGASSTNQSQQQQQQSSVTSSVASLLTSISSGITSSASSSSNNHQQQQQTQASSNPSSGSSSSSSTNPLQSATNNNNNNNTNTNQINNSALCKSRDPIPLPKDKKFDIALSNFDHITPYETHKVGVVYVSAGQTSNRPAILANKCGSPRYLEFLANMGTCIVLSDINPEIYFIGGLDTKGEDGKYAYFWKDNVTQVIFHVATFMPMRESDPQCNNKNRHIGNDHVCIVYNDSDEPFQMSTIKGTGQLISACIVISPLDSSTNCVEVEVLPGLRDILRDAQHILEPKILSNLGASLYARQVAIDLNLVSKIHERHAFGQTKEPYVSNWVERLRCIKRIRQRLDENRRINSGNNTIGRSK